MSVCILQHLLCIFYDSVNFTLVFFYAKFSTFVYRVSSHNGSLSKLMQKICVYSPPLSLLDNNRRFNADCVLVRVAMTLATDDFIVNWSFIIVQNSAR
jgi:hypothetical protein